MKSFTTFSVLVIQLLLSYSALGAGNEIRDMLDPVDPNCYKSGLSPVRPPWPPSSVPMDAKALEFDSDWSYINVWLSQLSEGFADLYDSNGVYWCTIELAHFPSYVEGSRMHIGFAITEKSLEDVLGGQYWVHNATWSLVSANIFEQNYGELIFSNQKYLPSTEPSAKSPPFGRALLDLVNRLIK
ncbi:MAG: hypothetical protein KDD43_09245 [Bdellovibrionales bacterium]|nr:hypothetical protein [Bdellovibrionales bacterium]